MPKSVAETDFSWSIVHDLAMDSYVKGIIWIANVSQLEHALLHPSNSVECPVKVEIIVVITFIKHTFFTIYGLLYPSEDLLRPSRIDFPKRTSQDAATPHPIRGQNPTSQTVLQQPLPRLVSDTYSTVHIVDRFSDDDDHNYETKHQYQEGRGRECEIEILQLGIALSIALHSLE